jgi:pyridoxine 5'-phosphate synthase PdxJ
MIITEMHSHTSLKLNIKSARADIKRLKQQIRLHTGEYLDWLYVQLDEACERLNRLQAAANRRGMVV